MAALHGEAVITVEKIAFTESATADVDYQIDHLTQGIISVDVEKQLGVMVRPGQPSPACPPTMGDYDAVEPAEPRPVLGTVFDPPGARMSLYKHPFFRRMEAPYDRPFCRMG